MSHAAEDEACGEGAGAAIASRRRSCLPGAWSRVMALALFLVGCGSVPAAAQEGFRYVIAGDLLGPWRSRDDSADQELERVARIFQNADAGFANLEGNLFDLDGFRGYPAAENGGFEQGGVGGGPRFDAGQAAAIKRFGINTLSVANNHSMDWGIEGLVATMSNLDKAGIVHAGGGMSLAQARAPVFLETPHGRLALVSAASTFLPMAPAGPGDEKTERPPRPGISALRNSAYTLVSAEEFQVLRGITERQGQRVANDASDLTIIPNDATFTGQNFRKSDRTGVVYEPNGQDRKEILEAVRAGKREAALAVFSIHAHESNTGAGDHLVPGNTLAPPEFLQALMHDAVDAGADIGIVHGPHSLRGIEIYQGKPIFYGMGSLFFEVPDIYPWPKDWFDSFIAETRFGTRGVKEIRLYPLRIRRTDDSAPGVRIGAPKLADAVDAARILAALQAASQPFGTRIEISHGVGIIRIGAQSN
ncbi:MAG: CapA family protein [Pseudoxanthomonas sp.]